ncbi:MAG: transposase [Rhodospirillaceae bacterium]|nr:transposase [Rhodospirillaceae bacterium]
MRRTSNDHILDNLGVHKSETATAALKERGAWFLFLPPHGPDLTPLRWRSPNSKRTSDGAGSIDALWKAVGAICGLYSPEECWYYLKAAGSCPIKRSCPRASRMK